ncbi:hypothetical protein [Rhodococcus sp. HNM0569]|uniref:hypothetical protein n=1 Tax=Rhodococcus sp. HNM0569 TaxID=2716340 RepID=UPI00146C7621|nr:hypothetical protein [Rhodococcus sp. HNM0569]NLU83626.1 hypothetical protein [Rhodococcus sp. HNM0569]
MKPPNPGLWYLWFGLIIFGLLGVIGFLDDGDVGGALFALVWAAAFGYLLYRHGRKTKEAAAAQLAARAEHDHWRYVWGNGTGPYGPPRPPAG